MKGSSPHPRGTQTMLCTFGGVTGIIPASAGNTKLFDGFNYPAEGSSPHPRGTRSQEKQSGGRPGIIPASAGNTRIELNSCLIQKDHPRIRGEHLTGGDRHQRSSGSSPHPRGTQTFRNVADYIIRIIPASAGNTQDD